MAINSTKGDVSSAHDSDELPLQGLRRANRIRTELRARMAFWFPEVISSVDLLRFVRMMVHDCRHHLSAVYAHCEVLSMYCHNPAESSEVLDEMRFAIDRITDLLESLILFAGTGQMFCPRRQSLARIIEQAVQMVRPHSDAHSVSVLSEVPADVHGNVDGKRLGSAIFNLVLNACEAAATTVAPGHSQVIVALHADERDVIVRVTDNGPGVPPELRDDLFRPFTQLAKTRGKGLGLSIARYVAREHGGDVYLEMSQPGKTVFVLKIPRGPSMQA